MPDNLKNVESQMFMDNALRRLYVNYQGVHTAKQNLL